MLLMQFFAFMTLVVVVITTIDNELNNKVFVDWLLLFVKLLILNPSSKYFIYFQ